MATVAGAVAGGYAGNQVQKQMQKNDVVDTTPPVAATAGRVHRASEVLRAPGG